MGWKNKVDAKKYFREYQRKRRATKEGREYDRKIAKNYYYSEKGQKKIKKYNQSERRKIVAKKYSSKPEVKKRRKKYFQSPEMLAKFRVWSKQYRASAKGKEQKEKYRKSEKGREVYLKYRYSEKGRENHRKRQRIYRKKARKNNPSLKIRMNLSSRMSTMIRKKGGIKNFKTIDLIGCSFLHLKKHLEKKFKLGMNWKNYGNKGWHIDHIMPCASFDLTKEKEQKKCFHYTNLQPLWARENIQKSDKIIN